MTEINQIVNNLKPKMENCRVFYINIADAPANHIPEIIEAAKNNLSGFDIRNVIFIPTRTEPSGWQYPDGK